MTGAGAGVMGRTSVTDGFTPAGAAARLLLLAQPTATEAATSEAIERAAYFMDIVSILDLLYPAVHGGLF
jgi:hypothetical protein